ncbi:MAG: hypothetical protein HYT93_01510 [Parcubacteria group bacterium]|nr:hypothetical protein [Parcubacteria group bacterium]
MRYKIAVVTPTERDDFYCDTVLDGLFLLKKENPELEFFYPDYYPHPFGEAFTKQFGVSKKQLAEFAKGADLIIFSYGKYGTDTAFIDELNGWGKTVYVDGSEIGKDRWRDLKIQYEIIKGAYEGLGAPNKDMQKKCRLYFRREKPYTNGMIPFPLGIESRFMKYYDSNKEKDIDFSCFFGQELYPLTRRYAPELTQKFCTENGFTCHTKKTYKLPLIHKGPYSPDKSYEIWARTKVGVSTGAAGYDSRRFWEILGNNCLIIAERFDLFELDSDAMNYKRIFQYNNLYDFEYQLKKAGEFLRNGYNQKDLEEEYQEILKRHSTKARVLTIINEAQKIGLLS